jgi:hypothetical protein
MQCVFACISNKNERKMKQLLLILITLIAASLLSCESNKRMFVAVYDLQSKAPLDSVQVIYKAGLRGDYTKSGSQGYTDSTGQFKTSFMIGCSFGCYDVLVQFQKNGFAPLTIYNPKDSSVVYLKPL